MAIETNNIFIGTELKLNINIEPMGEFTMDDYDWSVEVYCSTKKTVVVKKEEAIMIDKDNYVVLVDSAELGTGDLKCKVTAFIPDLDFPDTLRTEVMIIDTGIDIVKNL
jgi:hypothetical protein